MGSNTNTWRKSHAPASQSGFAYQCFRPTLAAGFAIGSASADQPHMFNALRDLRAARGELQTAMADKGGHRERAIGKVDEAIAEVQAGVDFDRHH